MKRLSAWLWMGLVVMSMPLWAAGSAGTGGDFASVIGNVMEPATIAARILNVASVICGAGFLMASALQYKNHRNNPQEVPLSRPITYLILGLVLVILPYFTMISAGASFIKAMF